MTREIKFRAWDAHIPRSLEEAHQERPSGNMVCWEYMAKSDYLLMALNGKYPIMQYTGLKDKNGDEIYEGDIYVSYSYINGKKTTKHFTEVVFDEMTDGDGYSTYGWNVDPYDEDLELVGNIYENPELLGGK